MICEENINSRQGAKARRCKEKAINFENKKIK